MRSSTHKVGKRPGSISTRDLITSIHASLPIAYQHKVSQPTIKMIVDEMLVSIIAASLTGEVVLLDGFGSFTPYLLKAPKNQRTVRGGPMKRAEEYIRVVFRPSVSWKQLLKDRITKSKED